MRPRTSAELNAPERLDRIRGNPYVQPRVLREALRTLLDETGITVIRDTLENPDVGVADRLRALELAYKYGIGTQTGLVDADGESATGVIALPALDMATVQADKAPLRLLPNSPLNELDADSASGDTGKRQGPEEIGHTGAGDAPAD